MPTKRIVAALIFGLFGLLTLQTVAAQTFDHGGWDQLLRRHVIVVGGGLATAVNYAGMAEDRTQLKAYLSTLAGIRQQAFDSWPPQEQLAFLINAYNAWTVELILTEYPDIESIKELGGFFSSPWSKKFILLLGETRSLNDIEHDLIRESGRYMDPRIHFAVNCASIGCPALRSEAYFGDRLEAQLEEQTRLFLSDRTRNRMDGDALKLSPVFKWYREDFERGWLGIDSLSAFVTRYAEPLGVTPIAVKKLQADDLPVDFFDYDWALNDSR